MNIFLESNGRLMPAYGLCPLTKARAPANCLSPTGTVRSTRRGDHQIPSPSQAWNGDVGKPITQLRVCKYPFPHYEKDVISFSMAPAKTTPIFSCGIQADHIASWNLDANSEERLSHKLTEFKFIAPVS